LGGRHFEKRWAPSSAWFLSVRSKFDGEARREVGELEGGVVGRMGQALEISDTLVGASLYTDFSYWNS
jgi:hypothetical protein